MSPELPSETPEIQIYRGGRKAEPNLSVGTTPISEYFGKNMGKGAKNSKGQIKGKVRAENGDNPGVEGEVTGSEVRSDPERDNINRSRWNLKSLNVTTQKLLAPDCESVLNPEEGPG